MICFSGKNLKQTAVSLFKMVYSTTGKISQWAGFLTAWTEVFSAA
jgi:hypothetical protein